MPRFKVADFMKGRKAMRQKIVMKNRQINEVSTELEEIEEKLATKEKLLKAKKDKLRNLEKKVEKIIEEVEEVQDIRTSLDTGSVSEKCKFLSEKSVRMRKGAPTRYKDGKVEGSVTVRTKRRTELFKAAKEIHGAGEHNTKPAQIGLIDAAINKSSKDVLKEVIESSNKVIKGVMPNIYKSKIDNFEKSDENMVRSIGVYYSGGVMGKKKYRKIYRDSSFKRSSVTKKTVRISIAHLPYPRLVPYNKLMSFVKCIPIGSMYSVYDTLCYDLKEEQKVSGCYRDLKETLLMLAEFYLSSSNYELIWFTEPYTFFVSLGGDGAPFGKYDTAFAWLIGFLNIGRAILSCNDNFLLFGGNCSETCVPVQRYVAMLVTQIAEIESSVYTVNYNGITVNVKFRVGELPNDMKMAAFLAGELSNSAKFFSSFADVSAGNGDDINGTFGKEEKNKWKPWVYSDRVKVVKKVEDLKKKQLKDRTSLATKRTKVTTFISSCNSRQEFHPLIGKLVDRVHIEPLHLKNNACALVHRRLLNEVIKLSNVSQSSTTFTQLKSSCALCKYIQALKTECHLSRLAKNIIKWFDETKGEGKSFDFRFTGKESRGFLNGFMFLIASVCCFAEIGSQNESQLHIIAFMCLTLRDCVSYFNRLDISDLQVKDLEQQCKRFFRIYQLFIDFHPTVWHLGHVVPVHVREMKAKYGLGLGLNSMEGRESKHVSIARYSNNTTHHSRWDQIFIHEFVSLVWLRKRGYNNCKPPSTRSTSYIPDRALNDPNFCYCGYHKEESNRKCVFCLHPHRKTILESVIKGKNMLTSDGI